MRYFKGFLSLLRVTPFLLFRNFFLRRHLPIKSVLLIQTGKLGDMVCTTPVFREVKKQFPEMRVIVSGNSVNEKILNGNPNIDEYVKTENLSVEKIKSLSPDAVVLMNPNPVALRNLIISGVPKIIAPKITGGFSPYQTTIYKIMLNFVIAMPIRMGYYAPREYLNLLHPLQVNSSDTRKELFIEPEIETSMGEVLRKFDNQFKVVIAPGAGNDIKCWPTERFANLSDIILERHKDITIILIGSNSEIQLRDKMLSSMKNSERVLDLVGKLSLEELKGVIKKSNLFLSADTGPIYIAEAFGIPTIDIIGPVDEKEQPPIGKFHIAVVSPNRKKPELFVMNARKYDRQEALKQVSDITVDMVVNEFEKLYEVLK